MKFTIHTKLLASSATALLALTACLLATSCDSRDPVTNATPAATPVNQLPSRLASVALYPDPLLAQVLVASQHPDQVIAAAKWQQAHPDTTSLEAARYGASQHWDRAVLALLNFPDVLASMASQPEWLATLGHDYTTQPANVSGSVQQLRLHAQKAGYLHSGKQQKVSGSVGKIRIEPANPTLIYVPSYDPLVVYGPWTYASTPVVIAPVVRTRAVIATGIAFGAAVALSNASWGTIRWDTGTAVVNNYYSDNSYYGNDSYYIDNSNTTIDATVDSSDTSINSSDFAVNNGTIHVAEEIQNDSAGGHDRAEITESGTIHRAEEFSNDVDMGRQDEEFGSVGNIYQAVEEPATQQDSGGGDDGGGYDGGGDDGGGE